jgi:hypothetical protein
MKKIVMVEVLSQFLIKYAVEVEDNIEHALDEVVMRETQDSFKEFSQRHLEPTVFVNHYEVTKEEYLKTFDEENDYLKSWSDEQKFEFINIIDYEPSTNQ